MSEVSSDRRDGGRLSFEFTFNGKPVKAYSGDSVASALVRAGVVVFSRSMKFHRPRGLYCGAGRCYSCAMRVNGVPGVRTCATRAASGMIVETETGAPSAQYDVMSVLDHVFRKQFDYHSRFIRPRFMTPAYQRIVRRMSSSRQLPDGPRTYHPLERLSTDVLIIGHGVSGTAACDRLRSLGYAPHLVERHGTTVFTPSIAFGYYENGSVGVLSETGGFLVRAKAVLIATGRVETGLAVANGDLPGVLLPEAVEHLVERGVSPGKSIFVVGQDENRLRVDRTLESAGCSIVGSCDNPALVSRIVGRKSVKGIEISDGAGRSRMVPCDTIVVLGPLVPYVNLAQQARCELVPSGDFWIVKTNRYGLTNVPSVFSCGGVAGHMSAVERAESGIRAADSIAGFLRRD